jgi:Mor family transcriptional regulator
MREEENLEYKINIAWKNSILKDRDAGMGWKSLGKKYLMNSSNIRRLILKEKHLNKPTNDDKLEN